MSSAVAEFLHSLFVLLSTASYAIPAVEGYARGSPFYTLLFLTMGCLSFALHCEETGVCSPMKAAVQARTAEVTDAMAQFLYGVMLLVVFEVRGEVLGRCVACAWAVTAWLQYPGLTLFNAGVGTALMLGVNVYDVWRYKRKLMGRAYFARLGVILAMAAAGAALFKGLHALWLWHGVWHAYIAFATYLLLFAQRHKRNLAESVRSKEAGAGAHRGADGSGGLVTPAKRRAGKGADGGAGATAANIAEEETRAGGKASVGGVPV